MSAKYKYAVLTMPHGDTFQIFRGKTARSAINRAKDHLIDTTPSSRADYEDEHGAVSDEEFLTELERGGFIITAAKLEK